MSYDLSILRDLFKKCAKGIVSVGDETRQSILITLMECNADGMGVGSIKEKTNLSRPAVSHHLKVLREAEIVALRKVGSMNFYYLNPNRRTIANMRTFCQGILDAMDACELEDFE